jgi:general secretion pathway protein D
VITAPPKIMKAVMSIIDKLDIRRAQVAVEVIIADMDTDKSASLGVNWATFSKNGSSNVPLGSFVSPVGGTSIVDLAAAAQNPSTITNTLLQGATFGVGRIASTGLSFAAMLRALRSDSSTNIISTPSTITLDNQEAEMKSAEEVPFVTGQFTNTTAATGGVVNPFQTIQRQEVGTILKVTPTIAAEGNTVQLKIAIEDSSIGAKVAGAVDLVTNKRSITTNVRIEDGGVVVLGGLTKDQTTKSEDRVPFLGNVPLIGLLFKSRQGDHAKNNLMIFIRPHIIRDDSQTAYETESKYKYMLEEERKGTVHDILPILPFEKDPRLPPLPAPPAAPAPADRAAASVEEKEKEAKEGEKARDSAAGSPPSPVPPLPPAPPPQ